MTVLPLTPAAMRWVIETEERPALPGEPVIQPPAPNTSYGRSTTEFTIDKAATAFRLAHVVVSVEPLP